MLRETKEYVQGTNSDAKETRTQIHGVDQKEERNIEPEKIEATRIQINEERPRNLQDIFKHSNIRIIGVPLPLHRCSQPDSHLCCSRSGLVSFCPNTKAEPPWSPGHTDCQSDSPTSAAGTLRLLHVFAQMLSPL